MLGSAQAMQNSQDQQRLMAEGMTAAESANALEVAEKEGQRVGSAAEERQRVLDRAAKERAISGLGALAIEEGVKNILVVDGTGMVVDFMSEHLLMLETDKSHPGMGAMLGDKKRDIQGAWLNMRYERVGLEGGERPDRLELCRRCILSGRFHAIVLSDLSEDSVAVPAVERELGPSLQAFMRGGGAVAVTTADAAMVLPMLERLVGVSWKVGGYYRTNWAAVRENAANVEAAFPFALLNTMFSAKAHAVRAVPEAERMFATTPDSRCAHAARLSHLGVRRCSDLSSARALACGQYPVHGAYDEWPTRLRAHRLGRARLGSDRGL